MEHCSINFFEPTTMCDCCKKRIRNEESFYLDVGDWYERYKVLQVCKDCFDKVVKTINEIKEA